MELLYWIEIIASAASWVCINKSFRIFDNNAYAVIFGLIIMAILFALGFYFNNLIGFFLYFLFSIIIGVRFSYVFYFIGPFYDETLNIITAIFLLILMPVIHLILYINKKDILYKLRLKKQIKTYKDNTVKYREMVEIERGKYHEQINLMNSIIETYFKTPFAYEPYYYEKYDIYYRDICTLIKNLAIFFNKPYAFINSNKDVLELIRNDLKLLENKNLAFVNNIIQTKKYYYEAQNQRKKNDYNDNISEELFKNCDDIESIKRRYKHLMSIYHPDEKNGDENLARIINEIYKKKIKEFG